MPQGLATEESPADAVQHKPVISVSTLIPPKAGGSVENPDETSSRLWSRSSRRVAWQWEHRTGFKNYDGRWMGRIEDAWQKGLSTVRLKAGKNDDTPMELFLVDMVQFDPKTGNVRRIRRVGPDSWWYRWHRRVNEVLLFLQTGRPRRRMIFAQYERSVEAVRLGSLDRRTRHVYDLYHETGVCAQIAKSPLFAVLSAALALLNTVWVGVDVDVNPGATLEESPPLFQAFQHLFCALFAIELSIRFGAFQRKRDALHDYWFLFDTLVAVIMICETWLVAIILAAGSTSSSDLQDSEVSALRISRVLQLTRLGRLARIFRAIPELLSILKGLAVAARPVLFTLVLLLGLLYIFGVLLKVQSSEDETLSELFPTVAGTMWILTMQGIFLDNPTQLALVIVAESRVLNGVFLLFIFLSNFMVLNMLIGILCNVVGQVSKVEKEEASVQYLQSNLVEILECHGKDHERHIHRDEFESLMNSPGMHTVLTRFGVNVSDLTSLRDVLFAEKVLMMDSDSLDDAYSPARSRNRKRLSFNEFLKVILRLRGGNSATVLDIVDLREFVRQRLDRMDHRLLPLLTRPSSYGQSSTTSCSLKGSMSSMKSTRSHAVIGHEDGDSRSPSPSPCKYRRRAASGPVGLGRSQSAPLDLATQLQKLSEGQKKLAERMREMQEKALAKQEEVVDELQELTFQVTHLEAALQGLQISSPSLSSVHGLTATSSGTQE